jgi:molybdenum cofactor biosynthesis enzyme MoaA
VPVERLSIEVTNRCTKGCSFCYNQSDANGASEWTRDELLTFVRDCAANGVRAVSFGGGEPLEWEHLFDVLATLRGLLFRSLTTHGLLLDDEMLTRLAAAAPEKVHVSIHAPGRESEVRRVVRQVQLLEERGVRSGVNLLVAKSDLDAAKRAADVLKANGIGNERIVYLPMRRHDTPSPEEIAHVAGPKFQSMSCLSRCAASPRFASIGWDRAVAWCSYTSAREKLASPTYGALNDVLSRVGLTYCGGEAGFREANDLVALRRRTRA